MDNLAQDAKDLSSGGGDGNQSGGQGSGMDKEIDQGVCSLPFSSRFAFFLSPHNSPLSLPSHVCLLSPSHYPLPHPFEHANATPTGVDQVASQEGVPKAADGAINKEVNSEVGKFT